MGLHPDERVAEYRSKGYWNDDLIGELFEERVRQDRDALALVDPLNRADLVEGPFRELTWGELDDQVNRMAQVLLEEGVGPGDVIGVQLPNCVEIVVAFLAILRLGAIVTPFPVQYRSYELTQLSNVANVKLFVTSTRIGKTREAARELADLRDAIPSLQHILAFGETLVEGVIALDQRMASANDRSALGEFRASFEPDPNDCVTICWTSGTESTPKGVPRTHYDWIAMSWTTVEAPMLTKDDVLINPFPMVNMAGINGMFLPWLRVGGVLVQHHPFDLSTFLEQVSRYRGTYTVAPPALLTQLLHDDTLLANADISSLRLLGSGSTPLAPSLLQGWRDKYGIEILNLYGSNEGIVLFSGPVDVPDPAERAMYFPRYGVPGRQWSFRVSEWMQVKIVDVLSREEIVEPAKPGELLIKGPTVFAGYLAASKVKDPFDDEGFLITGDLLEIAGDELQYLHYVDRTKDIVVRGGMKISASELETFIAGFPKVADVAVIAYPDEILGERACAVVVPRAGEVPTLDEIIAYLRGLGIATFKLPERLEIVESLPRNPVGKVLKRELRTQFNP
ncbi:MAG: acyl--CoA ligase [Acidimicrobiaceae bacterium]|nr:acyl--CoA ligase [Acidimicrobiaceae bacterium]